MRRHRLRWFSKGPHDWVGAVIAVPAALALFVAIRLIGPALSVQAAALAGALLAVALVRARKPLLARLRRRG